MKTYITIVPEENDDLKSGDEINEYLDMAVDLAREGLIRGGKVLFKLTNLPPSRTQYPGFERASELRERERS